MSGSGRQYRGVALFVLLIELAASSAHAAILHIADGDCAALTAAATSPPGSEPTLIVLAPRGEYGACQFNVTGNITIDGAGATILLYNGVTGLAGGQLTQFRVQSMGSLTLRNVNLDGATSSAAAASSEGVDPATTPSQIFTTVAPFGNEGELVLDSVSVHAIGYGAALTQPMIANNFGLLVLRNVSWVGNFGNNNLLFTTGGTVEISHSTIAQTATAPAALLSGDAPSHITIANSILSNPGAPVCDGGLPPVDRAVPVSVGGNVTSDASCGFAAANDRIVVDAGLGAFGDNGGLVETVKLSDRSPAIGNGLAANCEATDARGVVRNVAARGACDAGAYEYGGGRGLLAQGGMNGFFYDAAADGHYVTVQRLDWGSALVIWNTFDRDGNAAWIYAIGMVDGKHIHAGAAQNLGGRLQAGGAPTGSHGIVWGTIDIDFSNCFDATFHYDSPLPNFGSGQFPLDRLAFLGDLDCSD
jgi:hypothetical protein